MWNRFKIPVCYYCYFQAGFVLEAGCTADLKVCASRIRSVTCNNGLSDGKSGVVNIRTKYFNCRGAMMLVAQFYFTC